MVITIAEGIILAVFILYTGPFLLFAAYCFASMVWKILRSRGFWTFALWCFVASSSPPTPSRGATINRVVTKIYIGVILTV
jgi:hypothetical protein